MLRHKTSAAMIQPIQVLVPHHREACAHCTEACTCAATTSCSSGCRKPFQKCSRANPACRVCDRHTRPGLCPTQVIQRRIMHRQIVDGQRTLHSGAALVPRVPVVQGPMNCAFIVEQEQVLKECSKGNKRHPALHTTRHFTSTKQPAENLQTHNKLLPVSPSARESQHSSDLQAVL